MFKLFMKTKKPSNPLEYMEEYYKYQEALLNKEMLKMTEQKTGYTRYDGAIHPEDEVPKGVAYATTEEINLAQVNPVGEQVKYDYDPTDAFSFRWTTPKATYKPAPEPKPWNPFGSVTEPAYKNPKVIETEDYEKLVKNQKPEDWDENKALVDIEALTRTLVAREIAFRGLRVEEGSDDYLEVWDNVYDTIFKHKV